jgi:hypothetical protein
LQRAVRDVGLDQLEEVVATLHPFDRYSRSESEMIRTRVLTISILCTALGTSILCAGDSSNYRGLQFGMNVSAAAKQAGTKPSEVKTAHERPALIQEMEWRPRSPVLADPVKADPVQDGLLCFYNGELFRIIVTYDRSKVEGMTTEDMVEAISLTYGAATKPSAEIAYHSNYGEVAAVLARWEDAEYSYDLVRTGNRSSFAMVLYSKRLDALAQAAIVEAVRLDAKEAPQREVENQKRRAEEERLVLEKARSANKPNFRP